MDETEPPETGTRLSSAEKKTEIKHVNRFVVTLIIGFMAVLVAPQNIREFIWWNVTQHKVLASFFLLFIVLALSVIWSLGAKLDDVVFVFLNNHGIRTKFNDSLMVILTQIGNGLVAFLLVVLFYLLNQRTFAFQFILGMITLWMVVELCKLLIGRKRPYYSIETPRIVGNKAIGYSFPSGHTSQAFFMATIFAQSFHLPWFVVLGMYLLAALTGVTRIYLGAHYPRDVIAGAFLGTIWGYFASVLYGIVKTWIG